MVNEPLMVFTEKINIYIGVITAALTLLFGNYYYLFMAFFALNIVDYITGFVKAKYTKTENSTKGAKGILKKIGYWVVISIAFFISIAVIDLGKLLDQDFSFLHMLGYFTLATYIINEMRSILENLIIMGVQVPDFLTKSLEIVQKLTKEDAKGQE